VRVAGCLSDWSWCDVRFANDRGWIYADDLGYPYEGRRVAIVEFGPQLHLPVVTFSLNSYWDAHYRSRPFFRERQQWAGRVHVEASHGGRPPHGARMAERGAQPAQAPSAREGQPRERQQAMQPRPGEHATQRGENERHAQAQHEQAAQRAESALHGKAEERSRMANENAQHEQSSREAQHARPTQPQAARTTPEQHAQAGERHAGRAPQAPEREARATPQNANPRGEAERANAKARQRAQSGEEHTQSGEEQKQRSQQ
jgi:hypothetical protein